jgi:hypothetical protein
VPYFIEENAADLIAYNEQGLLAGLEFIARPPGTAAD